MRAGIGVLMVVTAAVRFSNTSCDIPLIWGQSEPGSTRALSPLRADAIPQAGHRPAALTAGASIDLVAFRAIAIARHDLVILRRRPQHRRGDDNPRSGFVPDEDLPRPRFGARGSKAAQRQGRCSDGARYPVTLRTSVPTRRCAPHLHCLVHRCGRDLSGPEARNRAA